MAPTEYEQVGAAVIASAVVAFRSNKGWADKAVVELPDDKLPVALDPNTNCIAVIMTHVARKRLSRWTDFLTTDGRSSGGTETMRSWIRLRAALNYSLTGI